MPLCRQASDRAAQPAEIAVIRRQRALQHYLVPGANPLGFLAEGSAADPVQALKSEPEVVARGLPARSVERTLRAKGGEHDGMRRTDALPSSQLRPIDSRARSRGRLG